MQSNIKPNKDDVQAERYVSLALGFTNANRPLSTTEIQSLYYPDKQPEAFSKAFRRDRKTLAELGFFIEQVPSDTKKGLWQTNTEKSYATIELTPQETLLIDVLCRPLVHNASFAYAKPLEQALNKVSLSFEKPELYKPHHEQQASDTNSTLTILQDCFTTKTAAQVTYSDSNNNQSDFKIEVYGFFNLGPNTYVVVNKVAAGQPLTIRTLRLDRFESVKPLKGHGYTIDQDFHLGDYVKLPYQLGEKTCDAVFKVNAENLNDFKERSLNSGTYTQQGDVTYWHTAISDIKRCAAWAIANNIVPVKPKELVEVWTRILQTTLQGDIHEHNQSN